jgi:hypothetical protein
MSHSFWNWLSFRSSSSLSTNSRRRRPRSLPQLEQLESRELLTAGVAHTDYVLLARPGAKPFTGPGAGGFTPAQIEQAYGISGITFNNGTVKGDGSGTTIAIIDAYDDPTIVNDVHQFDQAVGLGDPTLTKVNESGGSSLPSGNTGWAEETSLDVEWAHAIAPGASILLVEANSASYSDLFTAVAYAAKQSHVVAVSMSWGGSEFSGETAYDSSLKTPAGHAGVTFVASSGDSGAPASYPATSPNVLAVGGTSLSLTSTNSILTESAWSGSGGGISSVESQPTYQKGVVTQSSTKRTNPDVAYDANPNTGFPAYDSYSFPTAPWQEFGGTSDAAPQWAAILAIADQGRALAGLGSLDGATQTLPKIYSVSSADFHDTASGSSTGSPHYSATAGYDLVTGRGTPVANNLVADLVGVTGPTNPTATHFSVSAPTTEMAGTMFSIMVTALDANGNVVPGYTGTVQFASSDSAAVLPGPYTFTTGTGGDNGVHTFNVTLKTAGSRSVSVSDTNASSINGSATVGVSPAGAFALAFGQQPTGTTPGTVISPAVTVYVLDQYGNLETGDSTDTVTIALGNNPSAATLGGTLTVPVVGGIATFSDLSVSAAGNAYTLQATSATLPAVPAVTSASFNITAGSSGGGGGGNVIEGFENPNETWYYTGYGYDTAYLNTAAAHDGTYGLDLTGNDWFYRTDAGAQVNAGDTLSLWLKFAGTADGRAYFGFGASNAGTLSLVAAPNTNQLIIQSNLGFGFTNLAAVSQTYLANHWYRLEVDWGTSGKIVAKLFDSNGTTQLNTVTAATTAILSGGIAFRATGHDKYFDTVTDTPGVNNFVQSAPSTTGNTSTWGSTMESELAAYIAALRMHALQADSAAWESRLW